MGCDSIIFTTIYVNPTYTLYEYDTICPGDSYTFPDGTTQSNITTQTIYTSYMNTILGCDSIIETTIDVYELDTSVTVNGDTLISNATNVTYQWVDCENNYLPIPGATAQMFVPEQTGYYAVTINNDTCVDTSACYQVVITGLPVTQTNNIKIYPNPTKGMFIIEGEFIKRVEIMTFDGVILKRFDHKGYKLKIDLGYQPRGIYFVRIVTDKGIILKKIVLESSI